MVLDGECEEIEDDFRQGSRGRRGTYSLESSMEALFLVAHVELSSEFLSALDPGRYPQREPGGRYQALGGEVSLLSR